MLKFIVGLELVTKVILSTSDNTMPEPFERAIREHIFANKRLIVWSLFALGLVWLLVAVKELTALLFTSYFISLLLDPLVDRMEARGIRRGLSIFSVLFALSIVVFTFVGVLIPTIVSEYGQFVTVLPGYLETAGDKLELFLAPLLGDSINLDPQALAKHAKSWVSNLGTDSLGAVASRLGETLLKGYSFTLTIINLTLLPFFIYYITKDLDLIHRFIGSILPAKRKQKVAEIGGEILIHVQAFFKGQLTVSAILAFLYVLGLSIIGLPSAFVVGIIAGFLNIVPYLGVAIGLVLAIILTLVTSPGWISLLKVGVVFGIVQSLEGMVLTPKIVGESVGIHPLGVILALIVGGQLFGLVGMVLAIPAAAGFRVLFSHILKEIEAGK